MECSDLALFQLEDEKRFSAKLSFCHCVSNSLAILLPFYIATKHSKVKIPLVFGFRKEEDFREVIYLSKDPCQQSCSLLATTIKLVKS